MSTHDSHEAHDQHASNNQHDARGQQAPAAQDADATNTDSTMWTLSRFDGRPSDAVLDGIIAVARAAEDADGHEPFNEQTRIELRRGENVWGVIVSTDQAASTDQATGPENAESQPRESVVAAAIVTGAPSEPATVEMAVHPNNRGFGMGQDLADMLVTQLEGRTVNVWAHGDHYAARTLAERVGLERVRELWSMRLCDPASLPATPEVAGVSIRAFDPNKDADAWLDVNAAAFASHPEQGKLTRSDLDERLAEDWFDPAGFLLATDDESDELLGFHWTKVHAAHTDERGTEHPAVGEVYVVGVSPDAQGRGLGKALTLAGLNHLKDEGHQTIMLYVDADNAPAVALYDSLGFERWDVDVMYTKDA